MKAIALLFMLLFINSTTSQSPSLELELKIEKIYYQNSTDLVMDGEVQIVNKSEECIVLPKSFDLELLIFNKDGSVVTRNIDSGRFEYVNLITLKKKHQLKPNQSLTIKINDWRLFMYPLITNNEYFIQYCLTPSLSSKLKRLQLKSDVLSNKIQVIVPSH